MGKKLEEVPPDKRLYLTVRQAALYVGVSETTIYAYVNSVDPPPMLLVGNMRYLEREGLVRYLRERQTWHYN